MKRAFDVAAASLGLLLLSPLLIVAAVFVKLSSRGPILFQQERIGRRFRPFSIYKFRSMVQDAPSKGGPITFGDDARITRAGRILRSTKIDELPQLVNVLKGEMSVVGPRPEVRQYVEMFREDYEEILHVRPGITDLASIKYREEATVLAEAENPEEEYTRRVLPEKIDLAKEYVRRSSLLLDLGIIFMTLFKLLRDKTSSTPRNSVDAA